MQAYSVLTLLVGVLAIAASENIPKTSFNSQFASNVRERLQSAKLSADQADALQSIATEAVRQAVDGVVNRFRALCDGVIASGVHDASIGSLKPEERSIIEGSNGEPIVDIVRRILREGLPSKNIPPLDPFTYGHLPKLNINIPDVLQAELQLDNVAFKGLAEFQEDIPNPSITVRPIPPKLSVNVVFDVLEPLLQFDTAYSLDAHAPDLDIWGIGNLTFQLFSLRVNGNVSVKTTLTSTVVNPCSINIVGNSSKVELSGVLGGGLTPEQVGEIFTNLINENMNAIFSAVSELVESKMCAYFRSKDAGDWINLLSKVNMMPLPPSL